jgi:hypothetical protein
MTIPCLRRSVFIPTLLVAVVMLLALSPARAQTGNAAVAGVVTDSSGSVIAGAKVVLTNEASGDALTVSTGTDGRYTFPTVSPGTYSLTASSPAFSQKVIKGLELQLDQHLNESITLTPGSLSTTVQVTGEVQQVDTSTYDVGGVVAKTQIDTLPIQNRQYLNLGVLVPGTTQAANRSFYNSVQAGSGVYFYANGFYLDGVTNQQTEEGDPRQNIPMGAVAEFKTYTSSTPIELGWVMGGFTTVVTKSGANQIHGEAFEYYRDTAMTALNQFQAAGVAAAHSGNPPYTRNQWGGDVGGPIVKDKIHYYGAYDDTEQTASYTMYVPAAVESDYNAPGLLGNFSAPYYDRLLLGRVDWGVKPNQQFFVRYAQEWNYETRNGCGGSSTLSCYDGQIPRWAFVAGHTWEPNSHMVNDARAQYAYVSYQLGPYGEPIPKTPQELGLASFEQYETPAFSFPSFGWGHNYSQVGIEKRYELNDTFTIVHGAHQIKFGGDASYVPYVDSSASNLGGEWLFNVDEPFTPPSASNPNPTFATPPYEFEQSAVGLVYVDLDSNQQAYFIGDAWKMRPNLTVNYGIRWERQIGSAFNDHYTPNPNEPTIPFQGNPHTRGDRRNFGPRLGFSWDPFSKGKDVIRAGWGIYYNFIETEGNEAETSNFVACPITLVDGSPAGYTVPYPTPYPGYPNNPSPYCSTAAPSVTILSPHLRNPYQYQYSLGYSHQLSPNMSLSVDGIYTRGLRDYKPYDLNYPLLNGVPARSGTRPYPNFTQIIEHASTGSSEFRALFVKLDRRLSGRYAFTISYALESAMDNNPKTAPFSYNNLQYDWGPATIDQRQNIVGSLSYMAPWHILVGGILTYRSAQPFSATTTVATCAAPSSSQTLPTACNGTVGGGVLPSTALNADGTAQLVPGTKRDQGQHNFNFAALNTYRSELTGYNLPTVGPGSVDSENYLDFDLRLSKSLYHHESKDVQIFGQAFNLFGRENFTSILTTPTLASFGEATAASTIQPIQDVQIGELGVMFRF